MTPCALSTVPEHLELAARTAHEANRHYCALIGDPTQRPWDEAAEWQRESARKGVQGVLDGNGPGDSHRSWLAEKEATGWIFGPVKDEAAKQHPCMVSFDKLSPEQQFKDHLFVFVVQGVLAAAANAAIDAHNAARVAAAQTYEEARVSFGLPPIDLPAPPTFLSIAQDDLATLPLPPVFPDVEEGQSAPAHAFFSDLLGGEQ